MRTLLSQRFRLGLTSRLAIVGLLSALAPFLAGLLLVMVMPERIAARALDARLQEAANLAAARLTAARAGLQFELAAVDQATLVAAARAHDAGRIARALARPGASTPRVVVRPDGVLRVGDGGVVASVVVHDAAQRQLVVVRRTSDERRIMDEVARASNATVRLVDAREATSDAQRHHRTTMLDDGRGIAVQASFAGSPVEQLLRSRGSDLRVALLMLLAAGLLSASSVALVMNRMLRGIAANAERMSSGDFRARLPVVGTDAGARVARSLNELSAELQDRIGTLERTVERLDQILEAIDDGVCAWTEDGQLQTCNLRAAQLSGSADDASWVDSATARALREELDPGFRRVLLPVDEGERHVAVDLTVRTMRDGGTLQVFRDATSSMSIERARTNFLVTAAHELRTPLTSILGFAATLADESLELGADVRRMSIEQILQQSQRLDAVVDLFFETSMLARDQVEVTLRRVPVAAAIWESIEQLDATATIDLVGVDAALAVRADRDGVRRILVELLDNACKYGGEPITVGAVAAGEFVRIIVRDHGRGVPIELRDAVFEPFYRLDPEMRTDVGGAGMGLYSARRLAEAMGGMLAIDDDADGTAVVVNLPTWRVADGPS